jgi:hypothetical protein
VDHPPSRRTLEGCRSSILMQSRFPVKTPLRAKDETVDCIPEYQPPPVEINPVQLPGNNVISTLEIHFLFYEMNF